MADEQKNTNKLFKNFFSLSLLQVANNLLPILSIPIIVRIIGPDKFGVINYASVVVSYFILLTNYGFDLTATRTIALNKDDLTLRSKVFNEVLVAKTVLLALSAIIFAITLYTIPQLEADKKVAIYSFLITLSFVLFPNWLYQGLQELHNIGIFNFITKLAFTVLVLVVVRDQEDYMWQPFIISVAHILVGFIAFVWALKKYKIRLYLVPLKRIGALLWDERVIFFSVLSINIYQSASTLLLGIVQSSEEVAFYYAGFRLVIIMHTVVTIPLGMSLFPFIGESFAVSKEAGIKRVQTTAPLIILVTALMGAGVWVLAPFVITIFYGKAFAPAIGVLRILCFVPMIMGVSNLMGVQTMVNLKLDRLYTIVIALGGVIGVLFSLWLAQQFSYIGAAWAWFLTELSIVFIMWILLARQNIKVIEPGYFTYRFISESVGPMIGGITKKFGKK